IICEMLRTRRTCCRRAWRTRLGGYLSICRVCRRGANRQCLPICYAVLCPPVYDTDEAHVITLWERPFNIVRTSPTQVARGASPDLKPCGPEITINSITRHMILSITRYRIRLNVVSVRKYLIIGYL